ncbi:calnexin [Trichoderma longibrachiatum ATCC 18648]|uniref:Calnexin n=1 Tax=Trichoderma longibrachiatum ATCC 18648 TaxID=983965 RepID=A0A2T4CDB2_TRILO|nr:calnexin [Trichoderma longibrachiatum ATCC 18648]
MKFNTVAAAAALLAGVAYAEDVEESKAVPELPTFTPTSIKADFLEQFTDDWESRWKPSHAKKDTSGDKDAEEEWAYVGEWAVEEPYQYKGIDGDKGLVVKNPAAHHAISAKFPKKIDNKGKTLVVQYEVKLQKGLDCGGAYMKLLRDNKALHQDEFSNTTPYVIMFGPDKCGHNNRVHFIVNHKNPKTGEYEEKHLNSAPTVNVVKTTELYTLIVHPNNTFSIKQNGKPEDWDDEEDGDWIPPTVPNPKCDDVSGCGPWSKPMIRNPNYKGKWSAPYIDNPAYKGVWAPRKIKNPDYFEDKTPANFEPMGAIGFEIWTMTNDILFDNIYIGHSIEDAEKLANETFFVKHAIEKLLAEADEPKFDDTPKSPSDLKFLDDPVTFVKEKLDLFLTIAQRDPVEAIKFVPEVAGGIAAVFVTLIAVIVGLVGLGSSSAAPKKAAATAKEKAKDVSEAVASGADKVKGEVTKRTTRSQS